MAEKVLCTGSERVVELNGHEETFHYATCPECGRENLSVHPASFPLEEDYRGWRAQARLPKHSMKVSRGG